MPVSITLVRRSSPARRSFSFSSERITRSSLGIPVASSAVAQPPAPAPVPAPDPTAQLAADPLNTSASYAFIMDGDAGIPLYSKHGDEPMIPASMSKLMLYYMTFERLKAGRLTMTDEFTVSDARHIVGRIYCEEKNESQ